MRLIWCYTPYGAVTEWPLVYDETLPVLERAHPQSQHYLQWAGMQKNRGTQKLIMEAAR
jgi:hypothetical protein